MSQKKLQPVPEDLVLELEMAGIPTGSYQFQPLDAMRRAIARRTTDSFRDVPHFALQMKVELDALLARREEMNAYGSIRLSVNDFLIKASALALVQVPEANASFTARGLIFHRYADISVAVATESGLVTPIIRHAETKTIEQISTEMRDLVMRGKSKRLQPDEYTGGTFSISNLGMFGIASFGSVINSPQGCILSVGEAEKQIRVRDGVPSIASVLVATLTCDHRVVDGAIGARWLQCFRQLVEQSDGWPQQVGPKPVMADSNLTRE